VHRNKQRLTKIHQMIIRMRKLKLKAKWVFFCRFFSLYTLMSLLQMNIVLYM
jgi:hypothetical protein